MQSDLRHYINIVDQLNEAVKWQKSLFDFLFIDTITSYNDRDDELISRDYLILPNHTSFWIPIIPSMMERLETTQRMRAFHVLGVEKLPTLIDLQGQRSRQISVFTSDSADMSKRGVWGGSGIVAVLTGDVSLGAMTDIMSKPDKKGQRLVDIGPNNHEVFPEIDGYDYASDHPAYKRFFNDLMQMRKPILDQLESEAQSVGTFQNLTVVDENSFTGEQKRAAIKALIDGLEPILDRHKKIFHQIMFNHVKQQSSSPKVSEKYYYDELVMGNFAIEKLYVLDSVDRPDQKDRFKSGWHEDYFPEPGVFCAQPRRQCQAVDFPVEVVSIDELDSVLHQELTAGAKK